MKFPRLPLILVLALMGGANFYLDHQDIKFSINAIVLIVACSVATALPSFVSFIIASRTTFSVKKLNPYKASADFILLVSSIIWVYLLFVRDRPSFYEGASHMYVATWPVIIGLCAALLYVGCLVVQSLIRVRSKHNE